MAMPKQVQKQVEEAEALARELGLEVDTENSEEPASAEIVELAPTETEEPTAEEPVASETTAEEPEAPTEPVTQTGQSELELLEQKYSTLKGKYDAETQAMADKMSAQAQELQNLQSIVAGMQQQAPAEQAPAEPEVTISTDEVNEYGEDLLEIVGRKAMLALAPTLDQISQRLNALEQGVGGMQQKAELTDRQKVYVVLNDEVPNWRDVNTSEEFKAWLSEADPYAGRPRGALLNDAFEQNDAERVAKFFQGYLNEQTTVQPSGQVPNQPATPTADAEPQAAQVDLETLVSPGGAQEAAPASAQGDTAGKHFTQAEIAAFYSDVQKGRYKGREAEKDALERQIADAVKYGRIR